MTTFKKGGAKNSAALLRKSSVNQREMAAVGVDSTDKQQQRSRQAAAKAGPDPNNPSLRRFRQ
jgi:hypothetical protein